MPSGKTHLIAGALSSYALTCLFKIPSDMIWIGAIAGLLPDIDHKDSILGRFVPFWLFFNHRGFTHSRFALILFTVLSYLISFDEIITLLFFTGYASHLCLDYPTARGIQWKWPDKTWYRIRR